jgi:flagellar basal-body rod protein FlgF
MDRLVYLAAMAARNAELRQDNVASNLANASTNGFRSQLLAFRSAAVEGPGVPVRAYAVESSTGADFSPGVLQPTGRETDLAIDGKGWFAVRDGAGKEAYSRDGRLHVNQSGGIVNGRGDTVLSSDGSSLSVPPDSQIEIGQDGTISALPLNGSRVNTVIVGKLKIVNPPEASLVRGDDALFRRADGKPSLEDPTVRIVAGHVESSNVNPVESMVQMISAQRMYDLQLKMISSAEANARAANSLYSNSQ